MNCKQPARAVRCSLPTGRSIRAEAESSSDVIVRLAAYYRPDREYATLRALLRRLFETVAARYIMEGIVRERPLRSTPA
jgi:hypothetical protein